MVLPCVQNRTTVSSRSVPSTQLIFTGLIPSEVRTSATRCYPKWHCRYSPGFCPLQGTLPLRLWKCLHTPILLRTSKTNLHEESYTFCTIEFQRTKRLACLGKTADLHGVYTLITLLPPSLPLSLRYILEPRCRLSKTIIKTTARLW
jgi:hypothetical protein